MTPRGRRPAGADTRAQIVEAAREQFARQGYAAASLRGIARAAGVDPRLVHHYFPGGKSALFAQVFALPVDAGAMIGAVTQGDPGDVGHRLVRTFLGVWDDPDRQPALVALVRTALADASVLEQVKGYIATDLAGQVVRSHPHSGRCDPGEQALRAGLLATQMLGLALGRYVAHLPALAEADVETLAERIGPVIQGHLER